MNVFKVVSMLLIFAGLSACCPPTKPDPIPPPDVISLESAIRQVQSAVAGATASSEKMGTVIGKVTIVLAVAGKNSAERTQGSEIGIELAPVKAGYSVSSKTSGESSAGNTITLEFVNPLLTATDSVLGVMLAGKSPEEVNAILDRSGELKILQIRKMSPK